MNDLVRGLPYDLPKTTRDALSALAGVMKISPALVLAGDHGLLALIAGVILYRHLPSEARRDVMKRLQAYSRSQKAWQRNLYHPLLGRVLDTMVSPEWGLWSMSNEEVHAGLQSILTASWVLSESGIPSGYGSILLGIYQCLKGGVRAATFGVVVGVIFTGLAWGFDEIEQRYREELRRRMTERTSFYYK